MRLNLNKLAAMALVMSMTVPFASAQSEAPKKKTTAKKAAAAPAKRATATPSEMQELRQAIAAQQQALSEQRAQIQALTVELQRRDAANQQQIDALKQTQASASEAASKAAAAETAANQNSESVTKIQTDLADVKLNQQNAALSTQDDQKRIVAAESILNRFRFSGDVRVRGESFFQNFEGCTSTSCINRNRARIRLRFGVDGKINEDFTGGIYLASGAVVNGAPDFKDPVSTNETLTSFYERKTVGFDRGWITYNPQAHKWLSLTGGKFLYSWQRTPLTFDNDLNPEGFSEKISYDIKNPVVKNITLQGMQLLYNEVAAGADSNALGGQLLSRLQFGSRWTMTPSFTALNWNGADSIAQAASPVTLPQPITPAVGTPLPTPVTQPVRVINANAFTNASRIVGTGTGQTRAFVSGFLYTDYIVDNNIKTNWVKFPVRVLLEYEQNLRAVPSAITGTTQDKAYWLEGSIGQQRDKNDLLFGYSFARIDQDALISQFNESDMRAPTNVIQHRFYANWLVARNTTAAFTWWLGRTANRNLQNAALPIGLPAGMQDPFLNRLQFDLIYKF
jgi:hypothetical protein